LGELSRFGRIPNRGGVLTDEAESSKPRTKRQDVHELSIALSIVTSVSEIAEARGFARIEAVTLQVGEFSGVDKGALSFAWELANAGTVAAGSRLDFRDVPLHVRCPACGAQRYPPAMWELACPTCPGVAPEFLGGRELHVVAVEVPNEAPS
jgi:hydrogenase nickel incorporation protein HypA/HybF